jgi:hypothetical protein
MYQNCLANCHGGRSAVVLNFLAHAHFIAKDFRKCIVTLQKALHLQPNNLKCWYNMAVTLEEAAVAVLQSGQATKENAGKKRRTVADVERAADDLKRGTRIFAWLHSLNDSEEKSKEKLPYERAKAQDHADFCEVSNLAPTANIACCGSCCSEISMRLFLFIFLCNSNNISENSFPTENSYEHGRTSSA